ncbi:MAG TPA: formyltransferase family protein [Polyangiaceae bacterium]|jgi:methionyl-tRNA formyltransferase
MQPLKIAYFGLPLGACLLARRGYDIVHAVLSPVPAPGQRRLRRLIGSEPVLDAGSFGDAGTFWRAIERRIEKGACDALVSWFFTRQIPLEVLERAPIALGVHPSLLPRHRGPDPYFWAIDAGDAESGVTVHWLRAGYDRGPIVAEERLVIGEKNAWQLARALDRPALRQLFQALDRVRAGQELPCREQDEVRATWAPEPTGSELRVDWHWPTERVLRRVRALAPVPGLALEVLGVDFFAESCRRSDDYPRALIPGEAAIWDAPEPRCVVKTGDGAIAVEQARAMLPVSSARARPRAHSLNAPGELNEVVLDGGELARVLEGQRPARPGYPDGRGC